MIVAKGTAAATESAYPKIMIDFDCQQVRLGY